MVVKSNLFIFKYFATFIGMKGKKSQKQLKFKMTYIFHIKYVGKFFSHFSLLSAYNIRHNLRNFLVLILGIFAIHLSNF